MRLEGKGQTSLLPGLPRDDGRVGPEYSSPSAYLRRVAIQGTSRRRTEADILLSIDNEVCLAWLAEVLEQLRQDGRTKAADYLEAVLEEVVFEAKMAPK